MSEIKVGQIYAVGLRESEKRNPLPAEVLAVGVERTFRTGVSRSSYGTLKKANDGVRVQYLAAATLEPRTIRKFRGTTDETVVVEPAVVVARALIKPWLDWVVQDADRKAAEEEAERQRKQRISALNERLQIVQDALPEGQKVDWVTSGGTTMYGAVRMPLEAVERLVAIEAQYVALLDTGAVQLESTVAVYEPGYSE
jgi:hypothetical protein